MVTRSLSSSGVKSSVTSSKPIRFPSGASPSRGFGQRLLPGRRRLMRDEDSSGTDSDGEERDTVAPPSSVSHLHGSGSKRPTPSGQGEVSFPPSKRIRVPHPLPVPVSLDSGSVLDSGGPDSDVIYVRTERVSLSQTFLTSWLVRKV
jgi:hypothetical protein